MLFSVYEQANNSIWMLFFYQCVVSMITAWLANAAEQKFSKSPLLFSVVVSYPCRNTTKILFIRCPEAVPAGYTSYQLRIFKYTFYRCHMMHVFFLFTDFFGAWNLATSEVFWSQPPQHREAEAFHRGGGYLHWQVSGCKTQFCAITTKAYEKQCLEST